MLDYMKLLVCDLENTLIKNMSIWEKINKNLGNIDHELYEEFINNKITYSEWCKKLSFFHNFIKSNEFFTEISLYEIAWNNMKPYEGAKEFVKKAKEKGYTTLLISGGIEKQSLLASEIFEFDEFIPTNKIKIKEEFKIIPCKFGFNKEKALHNYCKNNCIPIKNVVGVGDSDNDISMLEFIVKNGGKSFLINPSKRIFFKNGKYYVKLNEHEKEINKNITILNNLPLKNYNKILSQL